MGFTRHYIKDNNFVLTLVRDKADNKSLQEHVRILTDETKGMHPFMELIDASELHDSSRFTEAGIIYSASLEFERTPYKRDKLAILVSSHEVHKLATMYTNISYYYRYDVKVFRDFQLAVEWLGVANLARNINVLRKTKSNY